jgi:hypothetical protein
MEVGVISSVLSRFYVSLLESALLIRLVTPPADS